ncbi:MULTISPECIES: anti sigma factor C-terminal domain-containing protein [unclassified Clostridium]|uniref:anti sigma factor C-terminal domain-containing protein n=1 Tax=unclassified Clostridium TaxID=2614128 RepID=UPI0025BCF1AC|nr:MULTISPECIES: anti sigma factor C-terminal domain-containing protein [unclassified Clostridium]
MEKDNKNINEELASNIEKENIEDIFSDKKIKRSIRITKIKSLFKIVFVFFVCLITTYFANNYYLEYLENKIVEQNIYYLDISSPNVIRNGTGYQVGFFSGHAISGYDKYINGVRVSLGGIEYNYGFLNSDNGKIEPTVDILPKAPQNYEDIEEETIYNGLGHRLMKFYHPKVSFKKYNNDLNLLDELEDSKSIEMALSFDRDYSVSEVQKLIAEDIDLAWYWVDTFNKEDIIEMNDTTNLEKVLLETSDSMIGFMERDSSNSRYEKPEERFILDLGCLDKKHKDKCKNIFEILEDNNGKIDSKKIRIIGVVVTGDKKSLSTLRDKPWIKASSFGVIVDKF